MLRRCLGEHAVEIENRSVKFAPSDGDSGAAPHVHVFEHQPSSSAQRI